MKKITILLSILFLAIGISLSAQKKYSDTKISLKDKNGDRELVMPDENPPHFMQFGIMSINHDEFRKKYDVAVIYQNCVISQFLSQRAKENNILVAKMLTDRYGESWKKDLGFIPYGL